MRLKAIVCGVTLLVSSAVVFAAGPPATQFTIAQQSQVPGTTLKAGTYSIRVVDQLSDRLIVRVDGPRGAVHATFLGVQNGAIEKAGASGPVMWSKTPQGSAILRGFKFPGQGPAVEFVYPKAEAVSIATVNDSKVPAIDPASEGKVADGNLSKDDMELVTLWLLSSTTVGPNDAKPGIQAERYQAPPSNQVASANAGPSIAGSAAADKPAHKAKPVIAKLPHTASEMPLMWLLGGFSFFGAGLLRRFRLSTVEGR